MGSGSLTFANDPLLVIPIGMQVDGSNPWFCMKKITRFGPPDTVEAARPIPGNIEDPTTAPIPAAMV